MTDEYGDGWVGAVAGYYNLWELWKMNPTTGQGTMVTRGTLADNHESGTTRECLSDGTYMFNTTANAAFAEDIKWGICDNYGDAGERARERWGVDREREIEKSGENSVGILVFNRVVGGRG